MKKENWVWMPHAGHFIVANQCRFHLNTYVGNYIVSTVGEYVPDERVREVFNQTRELKLEGKGDAKLADFLKKNGFEELSFGRTYETMVFRAIKDKKNKCCPYAMQTPTDLEMNGYNSAEDAYKGHLKMCRKWSKFKKNHK